jgi:photosystem II stability/assembly factor-like uncharacterized protein
MLTTGVRLMDGSILIEGLGGAVLRSTDGGNSFELHQQADRRSVSAAVETGDDSLLVVGDFGVRIVSVSDMVRASE